MFRLSQLVLVVLTLALVLGLAAPALAAETKGKIKSVDVDKNQFIMTDENGKDWTFMLDKDAKVSVANNQKAKLTDLKKGDEVKITYDKKGTDLVATEVRTVIKQ